MYTCTVSHTQKIVATVQGLCTNAQCSNQRLYIGTMARGGVVHMDPEHRWSNVQFFNHTGLEKYE